MDKTTPCSLATHEVWEADQRVKANRGTAGVEGQSIEQVERAGTTNLYLRWNRLASGSAVPPPVRRVDIPKDEKSTRPLGIPTDGARIAQMVAN